ncbi:conserved protein of unknown function [Pseudomonas marincola]|uniref:Uncharacterized protein n=1 Tax=Pseudomonas marincola TaxID=437900 RepID=A0A653E5N8_9PSED|nr:conserved protein of unknown function [Pseudomonas marincola]
MANDFCRPQFLNTLSALKEAIDAWVPNETYRDYRLAGINRVACWLFVSARKGRARLYRCRDQRVCAGDAQPQRPAL